MTLHAVGEKSGLSRPFLSRLERGQVSTSIANLMTITGVLGIELGTLFQGAPATADQGYVVARLAGRRATAIEATGYQYARLVTGWAAPRLDAFILTFPRRNRADVLTAHEGEELVFVLQGRIVFQLGAEHISLGPGDAVYFRADIPHMGKNVGAADARVLMIASPGRGPGQEIGWWNAPPPTRGEGRPGRRAPRSRPGRH